LYFGTKAPPFVLNWFGKACQFGKLLRSGRHGWREENFSKLVYDQVDGIRHRDWCVAVSWRDKFFPSLEIFMSVENLNWLIAVAFVGVWFMVGQFSIVRA
jgi:hypothetical protein